MLNIINGVTQRELQVLDMEILIRRPEAEKFRLGVDIDNVTANSSQLLVDILRRRGFWDIERDHITRRPFHESPRFMELGISREVVSKVLDGLWEYEFGRIELMDKRIGRIIDGLRAKNISIDIITTMGARNPLMRPNLEVWLQGKGIIYDTVSFVSGNSEKAEAGLHTIVDDEEGLAKLLSAKGKPGIIYDAPWNRKFVEDLRLEGRRNPLIYTVRNWEELGTVVEELNKAFRS